MKFNEKLQKLRKEKGLSQEALAEMLGVSRQAVSKWESGQFYPEMSSLIALSEIYGVTMDSLMKEGDLIQEEGNTVSDPFWLQRGRVYEYKSAGTLFGLPLVHIHVGFGAKRAKGFIAIGNIATGVIALGLIARGFLSLGLLSVGIISLGCLSVGALLALGAISLGAVAVGAVAVGLFAVGALSLGIYSLGACAVAVRVAVGDHAYGHIAVGRVAKGVITFIDRSPWMRDFSSVNGEEVRSAIRSAYPGVWNWVVRSLTWFIG